MNSSIRTRLAKAMILIAIVFLIGTVGFRLLLDNKKYNTMDAFYLTVVTLTTVGYGDISPSTCKMGDNAVPIEIFSIMLILVGMGSVLYAISIVTEYIVSGEMMRERHRVRMRKLINRVADHYIICGAGRTGIHIIRELEATQRPYVVIESNDDVIKNLQSQFKHLIYVQGNATDDRCIAEAGLDRAAGLVAALTDEKDNLFIVISLSQQKRERGDSFKIVAKVTDYEKTAPKLRSAGADVVISPSLISGRRMVSEMYKPSVTTFLDRMLRDSRAIMRIEQATVSEISILHNSTMGQADIPERTGLVVVAMRKSESQEFIYNPRSQQALHAGDVLIVMGDMERIVRLRKLCQGA